MKTIASVLLALISLNLWAQNQDSNLFVGASYQFIADVFPVELTPLEGDHDVEKFDAQQIQVDPGYSVIIVRII